MLALFREVSDIFSFNLDRLRLKKNLKCTYFSKFSVVFKIVKLSENHILPFIQLSTEGSVYKKVSLTLW